MGELSCTVGATRRAVSCELGSHFSVLIEAWIPTMSALATWRALHLVSCGLRWTAGARLGFAGLARVSVARFGNVTGARASVLTMAVPCSPWV